MRTLLCAVGLYGVAIALALAIDDATISIERVAGDGWEVRGIEVRVDTSAEPLRADLIIAQATIRKLRLNLARMRLHCSHVQITDEFYRCGDATVAANFPELGAQQLLIDVQYQRRSGAIRANLKGLRLGEGTANLTLNVDAAGRQMMDADLKRVSAQHIAKLSARFGMTLPLEVASGTISGTMRVQTVQQHLQLVTLKLALDQLTANNAAGTIATDRLSVAIDGQVSASHRGLEFRGSIRSRAGQAYFDPIFLDTGAHSLELTAQGVWSAQDGLIADAFTLQHEGVLSASGSARLDLKANQPVRQLRVSKAQALFPGAFDTYVQPFVSNDAMKSLHTSGVAIVSVEVNDGQPKLLDLEVHAFNADGNEVLQVDGLNGSLTWRPHELEREDLGARSSFSWRGASVFGLAIGSAQLRFQIGGHSFRLLEPAHVPLLDGALNVETLRIRNFAEPGVAFLIDATLLPISMPQLCRAFGWPEFGGHIGGEISKLRMREGVITLGTTLKGQLFDGTVAVRDLRLEQPFGNWPRFYANAAFDNLDLEQVTSAFSFGRITGRISGAINALELFNWAPVTFDARFFTPPDDHSKHRISQRAVESIGSLGGGGSSIAAALSSGFLRFFSDFNYDRIGLSCRLGNDVCVMDGIGPAPQGGYYLVKGRGVPRIDVIGNSRRVDWPRLVQQLKAATEADKVVVK